MPGTGKSSSAYVIEKQLECDSLVLNGSDERGIDTIRDKVKVFATTKSFNPNMKRMILLNESK